MLRKKGAIELSVNAIVVFVIALGMLGVGWFIIQKLKDLGGTAIDGAFDIDALQLKPTAQDPVIFDDKVKIKYNAKTELKGGYFNVNNEPSERAIFTIKSCKAEDNTVIGGDALPTVISSEKDPVEPSKGYGFNILIKHQGSIDIDKGTYVCDFVIRDSDPGGREYESKSVFVEVVS